jgi:RNA polymerase sigma factor (sigma-70 family)
MNNTTAIAIYSLQESQLVERLAPSVFGIARRLVHGRYRVDAEDLAQCGLLRILAFVRAGSTGTDWFLLQRASWAMRKALVRELRRGALEESLDLGTKPGLEPATRRSDDDGDSVSWPEIMSYLSTREKHVLAAIYRRDLTQQETAEGLGLSQPRIHQIHQAAFSKLRTALVQRNSRTPQISKSGSMYPKAGESRFADAWIQSARHCSTVS